MKLRTPHLSTLLWLLASSFLLPTRAEVAIDGSPLSYPVEVLRVIDGDTVEGRIALGLDVYLVQRIRLYGINTPEKHGPERERGLEAKAYTERWIEGCGTPLTLVVVKQRGKYGRIVGDLRCLDMSLAHDLWAEGLARKVDW